MIRYDKKLNSEINRVVRNYNAKVKRVGNVGGVTPPRVSVKQIKSNILLSGGGRRELRRTLSNLELYSKRGMEDVIIESNMISARPVTRYEFTLEKQNLRRARTSATRRVKFFENFKPTHYGEEQPETMQYLRYQDWRSAIERQSSLRAIKLNKNMTIKDFRIASEKIARENTYRDYSDLRFKETYIMNFRKIMESMGYSKDNVESLIDFLNKIPTKDFYKFYKTEDLIHTFYELYDMRQDEHFDPDDINRMYNDYFDTFLDILDKKGEGLFDAYVIQTRTKRGEELRSAYNDKLLDNLYDNIPRSKKAFRDRFKEVQRKWKN